MLTILDIDECARYLDNCDRTTEICKNTIGGYECEICPYGYVPVNNVCEGKYNRITIIAD